MVLEIRVGPATGPPVAEMPDSLLKALKLFVIVGGIVIVGGTAITGGLGGLVRTAIGALIISIVRIGMTFVGVDIFAQQAVFGAVLILAVAITIDRSKIAVIK